MVLWRLKQKFVQVDFCLIYREFNDQGRASNHSRRFKIKGGRSYRDRNRKETKQQEINIKINLITLRGRYGAFC